MKIRLVSENRAFDELSDAVDEGMFVFAMRWVVE
jgi:hypothetical protein